MTEPADYISELPELARFIDPKNVPALINGKTLTATALIGRVGVVELEGPVEPADREINFRALEERQAFPIDHNLHALVFENLVIAAKI